MSAGAFSDDGVVKASEKVTRVMVMAGKHDSINKKYGVNSYPQVFWLSPEGKKVADAARSSDGLIKEFDDIPAKHGRVPKWAEDEKTALATAKEEQKPLLVVYRDDKPRTDAALLEFGCKPLAEQYDKAVWVQKTLDVKSDEAKALGITSVPALWIIDPRVDDAKARVLKKIGLPKPGAALSKELASVLKAWKKTSTEKPAEEPKEEPKKE